MGSVSTRQRSRRRLWVVLGLTAFVLIDIVLIVLAMTSVRAADTTAPTSGGYWQDGEQPGPSTDVPEGTPGAEPEPASEPAGTAPVSVVAPARLLSALDADLAWRATTGSCPQATATLELTDDGGASWLPTNATRPTGVTAVQSIAVSSSTVASAIGLNDEDCAPQYVRTFVAGDNYASYPERLADSWYLNPANAAVVHAPSGDIPAPCTVLALAGRGADSAAVLCDNGTVHTTVDGGQAWTPLQSATTALAIAATDTGFAVAGIGDGCVGVRVETTTDATAGTGGGCFATSTAAPATLPGAIAVDAVGGTVWLWAGDALVRSRDGGATWS